MIKFTCKRCGRQSNQYASFENIDDIVLCPICDTPMDILVEGKEANNNLGDVLVINSMKKQLKCYGNDNTWYRIERLFSEPLMRVKFREIFFKAGGEVPRRKRS